MMRRGYRLAPLEKEKFCRRNILEYRDNLYQREAVFFVRTFDLSTIGIGYALCDLTEFRDKARINRTK